MAAIKKIKLCNFKRFQNFSVELNEEMNLLIGDNEAGKSSILSAIDLVLSGSRNKVDIIGLDSLFNSEAIQRFLGSEKKLANLPKLFVELYLDEQNNPDVNGKINSENVVCDGLRLICEPNDLLSKEIGEILKHAEPNFPFEYYLINFKTFSGESYTGNRKFLRHVLIDNSQISSEYATRDFVKTMYNSKVLDVEKNKHQFEYRRYKENFKKTVLADVNNRLTDYSFTMRSGSKANLETDLTISEGDINIENKGKGKQCFIKTSFALKKKIKNQDLDVVLIEEPENHLSHLNMKKLIGKISTSSERQLFITTHNDLISTRLDLRKAILLNSNCNKAVFLKDLPYDTAKFFMKAPDQNVLEFVLSERTILVEGDAEFILMEAFFEKITQQPLANSGIHVMSVDGTSFKRYLDLAKLLGIKTAVIRDNDGDFQSNCIENYSDYLDGCIQVFFDKDNKRYTFEVSLYQDNEALCDGLFLSGRKTLSVQDFMLKNKTDVAFELLEKRKCELNPPGYIKEAIEWIKK